MGPTGLKVSTKDLAGCGPVQTGGFLLCRCYRCCSCTGRRTLICHTSQTAPRSCSPYLTGQAGEHGYQAGMITLTMGTTSKEHDAGTSKLLLELFGEWHAPVPKAVPAECVL
jgi:hypothetical protein